MDILKLLEGIDCSCGRHHRCDIKYVAIERGAVSHLEKLCKDHQSILLVADENTFAAAGEPAVRALQGKTVRQVIFSGKTVLIPDEKAIARVEEDLDDSDLIIGVGSGVIQDLCKYVAFEHKLPYYIVATAPSMDGYASTGAAMILGGMKVTCPAGIPEVILADPAVLKEAPFQMIQAGYGDIIGKYSALNDWKLGQAVNDEYFCQTIYDLTYQAVQDTQKLAEGLKKRDEEAVRVLMEALIISGICMSFAGNSRPASGSEHHMSHFFEITGIITNTEYFPHGLDVVYSTVVTAELREKILSRPFPDKQFRLDRSAYEKKMTELYQDVAKGCIELQDKVGFYAADRSATYLKKEKEIRAILAEMPKSSEILNMLEAVDISMDDFYQLYGKEHVVDAYLYGKDLKDRYSVLWMHYDMYGAEYH